MSIKKLREVFDFLAYLGLDVQFGSPKSSPARSEVQFIPWSEGVGEGITGKGSFVKGTIFLGSDAWASPRNLLLSNRQSNHEDLIVSLLHEAAHFLVASTLRRRKLNYGIPEFEAVKRRARWNVDERRALMIDNYLQICFGITRTKAAPTKDLKKWWETEGFALAKAAYREWKSAA